MIKIFLVEHVNADLQMCRMGYDRDCPSYVCHLTAGAGMSGCFQTRTSARNLLGKVLFQGQTVLLSCSVFALAAGGYCHTSITVSL